MRSLWWDAVSRTLARKDLLVLPEPKVLLVLPVPVARKGFRGNKDLSAHRDLPDPEVKPGLQARKARSDLKARRVKQEPRDPQVLRANEETQEYRGHQDRQDLLALPDLQEQQASLRLERSRVWSPSPVTILRSWSHWSVRLVHRTDLSATRVRLLPGFVCLNNKVGEVADRSDDLQLLEPIIAKF